MSSSKFGATPLGNTDIIGSIFRTDFQMFEIDDRQKKGAELSQGRFLPCFSCFCFELTIIHGLQSWPHLLNCIQVRLLFEGGYCFFRIAPYVATVRGWLLIRVRLIFN